MKTGKIIKCKLCENEVYRYPSQLKIGYRFCSRKCWHEYIKKSCPWKGRPLTTEQADGLEKGRKIYQERIETHGVAKSTRKLISKSLIGNTRTKGRKASLETIEKIRKSSIKNAKRGKDSHWWKGGIATLQNAVRNTGKYKQWRKVVFERDCYICQKCGVKGKLKAHHIKTFTKIRKENGFEDVKSAIACKELFNINNGMTVCGTCHNEIHGRVIPY